MNYYYSPDSGALSEGSDEIDSSSLPRRADQDDKSRGANFPPKWRRKPLFPSHDLPPRPGNSSYALFGLKSHNPHMIPNSGTSHSPLYQRCEIVSFC